MCSQCQDSAFGGLTSQDELLGRKRGQDSEPRGEETESCHTGRAGAQHALPGSPGDKAPLERVSRICKKGHRVEFDDDGSYIVNKMTGEYMTLGEKNGVYVLDVWLDNSWGFPRQGR